MRKISFLLIMSLLLPLQVSLTLAQQEPAKCQEVSSPSYFQKLISAIKQVKIEKIRASTMLKIGQDHCGACVKASYGYDCKEGKLESEPVLKYEVNAESMSINGRLKGHKTASLFLKHHYNITPLVKFTNYIDKDFSGYCNLYFKLPFFGDDLTFAIGPEIVYRYGEPPISDDQKGKIIKEWKKKRKGKGKRKELSKHKRFSRFH